MRIVSAVASRLVWTVPTLLLATLVAFLLQQLIPGDQAVALAGEYATDEKLAAIRADLGLEQPVLTRYLDWIGGVVTGDLGTSYRTGQPVAEIVLDRLPVTLLLTLLALLIAIAIGVPSGVAAAQRPGTWVDRLFTTAATAGIAIPNFWLGMMLIAVFAVQLGWFPGPGGVDFADDPGNALRALVLPSVALGMVGSAEICRQVRSAMIENLGSDYVRTLRATGLSHWSIVWRHALKNSSLPLATILGIQVSHLVGGAVVVEAVFGLSGIGSLVVEATNQRDYIVIQAVVLLAAVIVLVTNLVVDISYRLLDPRIS
ncbi:ABC transporter permease [Nocardioides carbamazepini]|uniref:ABC transporter permease n=1 Tax=Nocardioides carbamazepini TaxID=2854259 RepID=UPI00214A379B|nr:ABC transporter permease [Nocardioides carbamazepini]MCR1784125.1 ABC transporter permease [Nocardioides carbamazepini]